MSLGTYSGNYTSTITLQSIYNPATVTATGVVNVNTPVAYTAGVLGTAGVNWTLTNQGTIQSVGSAGFGVSLNGIAGSISNTGAVQGTAVGVRITGGAGTVNNSTTISQTGAGGGALLTAGIFLGSGGTVTNTGTVSSQATNGSGVNLGSGAVTVVNGVSGSGIGLISGFSNGILGNLGASASTITNYGRIQSTNAIGVQLISAGTVNNFGTITTAQTSSAGAAVRLSGGGSLINNTGGLIQGGANGIQVTGTLLASVANFGAVRAVGTSTFATGISFNPAGGSISNAGTVFVGAFGNNAMGVNLSGGILSNSGLINAAYGQTAIGINSGVPAPVPTTTVINSGTILAAGTTSGLGVSINSGTVNNSGLISGSSFGVDIYSGTGTVTSTGTIAATTVANNSNTVLLSGGGRVQNSGVITNAGHGIGSFAISTGNNAQGTVVNNQTAPGSGLISAYHIAIITGTAGGPSTVTNYGTILSTASLSNYPAIQLRDGGTITNHTSGRIAGGSNGVQVLNAPGTVTNSGVISGTASGAGTVNGSGVFLAAGGTVFNSGTISDPLANNANGVQIGTGGGFIINTGLITAYHDGIGFFSPGNLSVANYGTILSTQAGPAAVTGFAGFAVNAGTASSATITNFGLIAVSQTAGGGGVLLQGGGTVINQAGATVNGAGGNAVSAPGTSAPGLPITVINSGTLVSSSTSNSLVYLGHGGSVTNNAGGLISANGRANAISSPVGGVLTNSGTILSALSNGVNLRGGAGTITNFGTIAHTGLGTNGEAIYLGAGGAITNYGLVSGAWPGAPVPVGYPGAVEVKNQAITLKNFGTITNPNPSNGINLLPGGTIINGSSNATSATISAVRNGIYIGGTLNVPTPGALGFIDNYGTIASTGRNGVSMVSGGTVTNRGLIAGYRNGVSLTGAAGTIANFGVIAHTGGGTAGEAVYFGAGGTVTNYGLISGSRIPTATNGVTGYAAPVNISNQAGLVLNVGTIAATNIANGVNILAGGRLVNGSPTATGATISALHTGVYMGGMLGTPTPGAFGLVANYGTIINSGTGGGVSLASGGDIDNRGLIVSNGNGISLRGTFSVLTNFGSVMATGTVGQAVYLNAGGAVTNYGLISGARTGSSGTVGYPGAIDAHNQPVTVLNLGTITNPNNSNGVNLLAGGTLINGSQTGRSATISAPHGGVYMGGTLGTPTPGAVGTVVNYGTILNSSSEAPAIRMVSGGYVTNYGVLASGRTGISFGNIAGTIDNFGGIFSSAPTSFTAGAGVYLQSGGYITNEAGAFITAVRSAVLLGGTAPSTAGATVVNYGVLTGNVGISVGTGDVGNNTIDNFGTIVGTSGTAIDLANDGAQIIIEPGSQIQGTIANFHAGDSIDLPGVSAFSLNYVNGTLSLFNQTTPVAQLAVSTPYVNPQFNEAPDGSGGTIVTVTPPGGPVMFDFIYRYNGSGDYYYGKVADDGSFGYQVGQQIATGAGTYMIFNQEPGAVGSPAGSVFITYVSHAGLGAASTTPLKFGGGQPAGSNGLGSESDSVIGTDGQPHLFGSGAPPNFPLDQLFGFIFSYADGITFYTGTVADDGSFGYGAVADGSGVKQIFDSAGNFQGYYTIYREGPTDQSAGKVTINRYFSGQTGQAYDVDQSVSGGGNGLGSETGVIVVNGQQVTFGDPPEAVLPATNPAFAIPGINTADPTAAAAQIYQQLLGRAADSGGLALYAGKLANGASVADVQNVIAHSQEAQNDLNLAYRQVLGRDADSGGLATYEDALANGIPLSSVRLMLLQSPEAQNDLNQLYRQVLGRDADNGGLGTYTSVIANGGSLADVRSILAHSGEAQNDLQLIYNQVLGRDADSGGLVTYQDALASGWSLSGVRAVILHSAEAQGDLARLFDSALGRDPNAAELAGADNRLAQGASLQGLQSDLAASGSAGGFTAVAVGGGDMTLVADAGPTSFLFNNAGFGNDTILGFDPSQDAMVLGRAQAPDFPTALAEASQTASGTLIALGPAQSILLNGVPLSGLHASNFQFV